MEAVALGRRQRFGDVIQRQTRKSRIDTPGHEGGTRPGAFSHRADPAPQRIVHRGLQAKPPLSPQCFKLDADVGVQGLESFSYIMLYRPDCVPRPSL